MAFNYDELSLIKAAQCQKFALHNDTAWRQLAGLWRCRPARRNGAAWAARAPAIRSIGAMTGAAVQPAAAGLSGTGRPPRPLTIRLLRSARCVSRSPLTDLHGPVTGSGPHGPVTWARRVSRYRPTSARTHTAGRCAEGGRVCFCSVYAPLEPGERPEWTIGRYGGPPDGHADQRDASRNWGGRDAARERRRAWEREKDRRQMRRKRPSKKPMTE